MNNRGEVSLIVMGVILLVGAVAWVLPKAFHGESRRAEQSQETTENLLAATTKQGAVAAASVVKIGEANATAPESPEKSFIGQEVGVALSSLPPPDALALIEAEKRKNAVLTGQLEEARRLYGEQYKENAELSALTSKAITAKRASDDRLQEVAALHRGAERQRNQALMIAGGLFLLWIWTKTTHFSQSAIGSAVADIRKGGDPIVALDGVATQFQQKLVNRAARLKS